MAPSDLHVLRTPPAFVLSQDQTRHSVISSVSRHPHSKVGDTLLTTKHRCCVESVIDSKSLRELVRTRMYRHSHLALLLLLTLQLFRYSRRRCRLRQRSRARRKEDIIIWLRSRQAPWPPIFRFRITRAYQPPETPSWIARSSSRAGTVAPHRDNTQYIVAERGHCARHAALAHHLRQRIP